MGSTTKKARNMTGQDTTKKTVTHDGRAVGAKKRRYTPRARACVVCGTQFKPKHKDGQYCSKSCSEKAFRQRRAKERAKLPKPSPVLAQIVCVYCGRSQLVNEKWLALYCSQTCRNNAYKTRRARAIEMIARLSGKSLEVVNDTADSVGIKKLVDVLLANGYHYDDHARQWVNLKTK